MFGIHFTAGVISGAGMLLTGLIRMVLLLIFRPKGLMGTREG